MKENDEEEEEETQISMACEEFHLLMRPFAVDLLHRVHLCLDINSPHTHTQTNAHKYILLPVPISFIHHVFQLPHSTDMSIKNEFNQIKSHFTTFLSLSLSKSSYALHHKWKYVCNNLYDSVCMQNKHFWAILGTKN